MYAHLMLLRWRTISFRAIAFSSGDEGTFCGRRMYSEIRPAAVIRSGPTDLTPFLEPVGDASTAGSHSFEDQQRLR